jgi:uncharacterized OB-fold protein
MQAYAGDGRPLPLITPVTRPYFDAAREHRLIMQRCPRDGFFFYPRGRCPGCLQTDWSWQPVRNSGRIHSFTIERMGQDPGMRAQVPFVIAVIDLDDGPRMTGNVVECPLEAVRVGMPVTVFFEVVDDTPLARFRPAIDG